MGKNSMLKGLDAFGKVGTALALAGVNIRTDSSTSHTRVSVGLCKS